MLTPRRARCSIPQALKESFNTGAVLTVTVVAAMFTDVIAYDFGLLM
jgi:hypothetical protein